MGDQTLVVLNQGGGSNESVGIRIEKEVEGVAMVDGTPYLSQRGPLRPRFGLAGIARCGSGLQRLCSRISGSSR
ncbi:MAG: hypothetical protein KF751_06150 [Nitrospira sp.]|nr:hypothetical protein [Nitrospira sp.]